MTVRDLIHRLQEIDEKAAAFDAIERLRANEGASVEIVCDNPEADETHETTCVVVIDNWTYWRKFTFYGPTLAAALATADHERSAAVKDAAVRAKLNPGS